MGSLLSDVNNTITKGDVYVVKEKIFERVLFNISNADFESKLNILYGMTAVKKYLKFEIQALSLCTVKNLYETFCLSPEEIILICSDPETVERIDTSSYSRYSLYPNDTDIFCFDVNLENAISICVGESIFVKNEDGKLINLRNTPKTFQSEVKSRIRNLRIHFNTKFYEELERYCEAYYAEYYANRSKC